MEDQLIQIHGKSYNGGSSFVVKFRIPDTIQETKIKLRNHFKKHIEKAGFHVICCSIANDRATVVFNLPKGDRRSQIPVPHPVYNGHIFVCGCDECFSV